MPLLTDAFNTLTKQIFRDLIFTTNLRSVSSLAVNNYSEVLKQQQHVVSIKRSYNEFNFYLRVSIASYASTGIARGGMSVRPSVHHTPVLYQNEES